MTGINNDYDMYADLVKRVKSGDENAFTEIYEKSQRLVYTTCYGILNNEQDAEDAMQETYISVYNGINDLEGEMAFLPWIKRIAANKALDKCRGRKDTASYDDAVASEEIGEEDDNLENLPEALILEKDKRDTLYKIMRNELSDDQFQTILLFYYDELSVKDIAQSMQCPENTIKTKLRLARSKIKSGIERYEKDNKVSLMGAVAGTLTLGRFFTEYYGDVRIPAPKNLPFRIAAPKGTSTAGKAAAKTAGKAAAASAKTAAGASVAKTLGIVGASVAGIGIIIGAVIGINAMLKKDDVEPSEPEISVIEETTAEEPSVIETTTETSAATTETQPSETKKTMEEAYLEVLSAYEEDITRYEEEVGDFGELFGNSDTVYSINFLDINDDGVIELAFAYMVDPDPVDEYLNHIIFMAIYTYSETTGEAVCLLDTGMCSPDDLRAAEAVVLDNGNILIVADTVQMQSYEVLKEIELNPNNTNGNMICFCRADTSINSNDDIYLLSNLVFMANDESTLSDNNGYVYYVSSSPSFSLSDEESITVDEYVSMYNDYKSRVVLPLISFDMLGSFTRREDSILSESVYDKANYYTLNDFVAYLGGDPAAF